jgi:hypothetical protein
MANVKGYLILARFLGKAILDAVPPEQWQMMFMGSAVCIMALLIIVPTLKPGEE